MLIWLFFFHHIQLILTQNHRFTVELVLKPTLHLTRSPIPSDASCKSLYDGLTRHTHPDLADALQMSIQSHNIE